MNVVTLAVAGSRKTQSIVDACATGPINTRRLALTLTTAGQDELAQRLRRACLADQIPDTTGWFAFLLRHWIKPYIYDVFPSRRVTGFNFDGGQEEGAQYRTGAERFLDSEGRAYRRFMSKLAFDIAKASNGAVLDRLSRIYDEIYIDEVQDLVGYDLELLLMMLKSPISIQMVGDVRQSLISTNDRDPKHPQYRGLAMARWFALQEKAGRLRIERSSQTFRSIQPIVDFADSIFSAEHGFGSATSLNDTVTEHDGVFAVSVHDFPAYQELFSPQCLRHDVRQGADITADFQTFGVVKGRTWKRVAIAPTGTIINFIAKGKTLTDKSACGLYVAVTRAEQSVAFVVDDPSRLSLPCWTPDRQPSGS